MEKQPIVATPKRKRDVAGSSSTELTQRHLEQIAARGFQGNPRGTRSGGNEAQRTCTSIDVRGASPDFDRGRLLFCRACAQPVAICTGKRTNRKQAAILPLGFVSVQVQVGDSES